jgi:hypothetical protein
VEYFIDFTGSGSLCWRVLSWHALVDRTDFVVLRSVNTNFHTASTRDERHVRAYNPMLSDRLPALPDHHAASQILMASQLTHESFSYGLWLRWTTPCELVLPLLPTASRARPNQHTERIPALILVATSSRRSDINAQLFLPGNGCKAILGSTTRAISSRRSHGSSTGTLLFACAAGTRCTTRLRDYPSKAAY